MMNTADLVAQLQSQGFKILYPFNGEFSFVEKQPGMQLKKGLLLDTETTGREATDASGKPKDKIIEIGLVQFEFDALSGQVVAITDRYNALEDPGMPIPPEATAVNGITDEMVKGHRIDDARVRDLVLESEFVIAHNSSFDREFCELRFDDFIHVPWACSRMQINWEAEKIGSAKLDYIAFQMGFHYSAHRAEMDCLALLNVLQKPLPESQTLGLSQLWAKCFEKTLRVYALNAAFEAKDVLAKKGYRWGPSLKTDRPEKAWYIEVSEDDLDAEIAWLKTNVYRNAKFSLRIDSIDGFSRFSRRVTSTRGQYCS